MVLYFDVFAHPLTVGELERLVAPGRPDVISIVCEGLEAEGLLICEGRFRFRPGAEATVRRRAGRAARAERLWPQARRAAAMLSRHPFVRGVLVTGSLSKNSVATDADVDFLLLVEPGRVWTLKTMLQALRRALPRSARELLCTNYLLDTAHLAIDDRNLFTAVELATAVPLAGREACVAFLRANAWASRYVPGLGWSITRAANLAPGSVGAPVAESRLGPLLSLAGVEGRAMTLWSSYWNRKYSWLGRGVRAQRFKRRAEISTNHLHDFQGYVLREVASRVEAAGLNGELSRLDGPVDA